MCFPALFRRSVPGDFYFGFWPSGGWDGRVTGRLCVGLWAGEPDNTDAELIKGIHGDAYQQKGEYIGGGSDNRRNDQYDHQSLPPVFFQK